MSTNYIPGQPDDDDPRPDGAEVVPFPARTPAHKTDWHLAISDDDRRRKFTSRCA